MNERPHISPSQIELFGRCPEAWRRSYIEKHKIPPGIAMLVGTGVHEGCAVNFRQKVESRRDLPEADIVEASVEKFRTETAGGYELTDAEAAKGTAALGEATDQVAGLARVVSRDVCPEYQPVLVERSVRIALPGASRDLYGIVDLADEARRVVDYKTAGKAKSQADVDGSTQLTYYAAAHLAVTGEPAHHVVMEVLVKTTRPYRQVLISERDSADFSALVSRVNVMLQAVEAGIFPPAAVGCWWCAPKFCGYWSTCPYVNSQRRAAAAVVAMAGAPVAGDKPLAPVAAPAAPPTFDFLKTGSELTATNGFKDLRSRLLDHSNKCVRCQSVVTRKTMRVVVAGRDESALAVDGLLVVCRGCEAK